MRSITSFYHPTQKQIHNQFNICVQMFIVQCRCQRCIAIILFAYWWNNNYRQICINESSTRIIDLWNKTCFNCNYNKNGIYFRQWKDLAELAIVILIQWNGFGFVVQVNTAKNYKNYSIFVSSSKKEYGNNRLWCLTKHVKGIIRIVHIDTMAFIRSNMFSVNPLKYKNLLNYWLLSFNIV